MNESIFDNIGEIYAKYRPTYPRALFDYLQNALGLSKDKIVADIGSGTGILTRQLNELCNKIFAIEPNESMRKEAEKSFRNFKSIVSIAGTAENTMLPNHSVDFITAAQSFHWFDRLRFKQECRRILKLKGKVILIWNSRDSGSKLVKEIDSISMKYCSEFSGFSSGMRGERSINDFEDFFKGKYETMSFHNDIIFDKQRFIGLHQSASYRLNASDNNYSRYIDDLSNIFELYSRNGILLLPNFTKSYVGYV